MWAINFINKNPDWMVSLNRLCQGYLYQIFNDENILEQLADWKYDMENGEDYYELVIEEDD